MVQKEEADRLVAGVVGGDLDGAAAVDQIGVHAELVLVGLEHPLKGGDPQAHSHGPQHGAAGALDLGVHKDRNVVVGGRLVIIHHHPVVLGEGTQRVIPGVFRLVRRQDPVQPVEVIVALAGLGDQKDRVVAVFVPVGAQIFPDAGQIGGILQRGVLLLEKRFEKAVVGHGQRDVHRPGKGDGELVVDPLGGKGGHLLDAAQGGGVVGPVTEQGGQDKTDDEDQAHQGVGPGQNIPLHVSASPLPCRIAEILTHYSIGRGEKQARAGRKKRPGFI